MFNKKKIWNIDMDPILWLNALVWVPVSLEWWINAIVWMIIDEKWKVYIPDIVKQTEKEISPIANSYCPQDWDRDFNNAILNWLFKEELILQKNIRSFASNGWWTWALHLGFELISRYNLLSDDKLEIIIPIPTWSNHLWLAKRSGLNYDTISYLDESKEKINIDWIRDLVIKFHKENKKWIILLQLVCHNWTWIDFTENEKNQLIEIAKNYWWYFFIDAAYIWYANWIDQDKSIINDFMESWTLVLLAISWSKNVSYNYRVWSLVFPNDTIYDWDNAIRALSLISRTEYSSSNPLWQKVWSKILNEKYKYDLWKNQVESCKDDIIKKKILLQHSIIKNIWNKKISTDSTHQIKMLTKQSWMFWMLPLSKEAVEELAWKKWDWSSRIALWSSNWTTCRVNISAFPFNRIDEIWKKIASKII